MKEQKDLIEKIVKSNPKFSGNEDLFEDFCSETYKKSYLILESVKDINSLEAYIKRVVSSAIIDVLKSHGRVIRSTKGYLSIKEIPLAVSNSDDEPIKSMLSVDIVSDNESNNNEPKDDDFENRADSHDADPFEMYPNRAIHLNDNVPPNLASYLYEIKDPKESIEDQIIRKDIIENIINLVKRIDNDSPNEQYLKLFYYIYFLQKKQREIAEDIELSQAEVSKRLVQLSRLIKENLY